MIAASVDDPSEFQVRPLAWAVFLFTFSGIFIVDILLKFICLYFFFKKNILGMLNSLCNSKSSSGRTQTPSSARPVRSCEKFLFPLKFYMGFLLLRRHDFCLELFMLFHMIWGFREAWDWLLWGVGSEKMFAYTLFAAGASFGDDYSSESGWFSLLCRHLTFRFIGGEKRRQFSSWVALGAPLGGWWV